MFHLGPKNKNTLSIYLIFLFAAATLAACGSVPSFGTDDDEFVLAFPSVSGPGIGAQNPYPEPAGDLARFYGTPPMAVLQSGEHEQTAALGSYCWTQLDSAGSPVEACSDSPAYPTPQVFLPGNVQFNGRLRLPIPVRPAGVSLYVMPVSPSDVFEPPSGETILWKFLEGSSTPLTSEIEQDLQLELQPGLNVLYVDARWEGLGSVGYGFLVEARVP